MKTKILSAILVFIMIINIILTCYAQDEEQRIVIMPFEEVPEETSEEMPEEVVEEEPPPPPPRYDISEEEAAKLSFYERINHKLDPNDFQIYSESCVLIEEKTGRVLYEKGMHERKYPASITKILTAIIVLEKCSLDEKAVVSQNAVDCLKPGYTKANVQVGEEFTVEELLEVMMLQSANEVCVVLAEHVSGSVEEFSKLMNKTARDLGCFDSNFVNPNGMHDENHYSSAYDMAMIGRYAMQNKEFRRIITTSKVELPHTEFWGEEQETEFDAKRIFYNRIQLMNPESVYYYPYTIGIKAGFTTPAKNCFVGASNKDGRGLITCIMHGELAEDNLGARYCDTINLFEYGYRNFEVEKVNYEVENKAIIAVGETEEAEEGSNAEFIEDIETQEIDLSNNGINTRLNFELIKVLIGILIIILVTSFFVIRRSTIGKRELTSNLYKINLPKGKGRKK